MFPKRVGTRGRRFTKDQSGSVAVQFALAVLPITGLIGAAVDYTRASRLRVDLQEDLDSAVLAGTRDQTANWRTTALNVFNANAASTKLQIPAPVFEQDADGNVSGTLSMSLPTQIVKVLGLTTIGVGVQSKALLGGEPDTSCILTLGSGDLSEDSMTFNGGPNLKFDQCTIRSNSSMRCNGHDGGSIASIATGTVGGCSNPEPNSDEVDDIYAPLASNIAQTCGASRPGATWKPGQPPAGITTIDRGAYTEYHVCGKLTLSGSGSLLGNSPTKDSVIIVENGGLAIDDKSDISTQRVAIVLTGDGSQSGTVSFPNGNGKASTLSLSPPTDAANPWRGVALYQDPALTDTDADWGPGATINVDGVAYMPNSDLLMRGNSASNLSGCTKIVTRTFRTNGSVNISYKQDKARCAGLGMRQWAGAGVYLAD